MFKCVYLRTNEIVTVYAVDFMHDAFLICQNGKFKWRGMDSFRELDEPVGEVSV